MPSLGEFVNAVRDCFPSIPEIQRGRGITCQWRRPPLIVDESVKVSGIALADFVIPRVTTPIAKLRGLFEEYVEQFYVKETADKPNEWLRAKLKMSAKTSDLIFPATILNKDHHLAALVFYAGQSSGVSEVVVSTDDCYVVLPNKVTFGIAAKKINSKFNNGIPVHLNVLQALSIDHMAGRMRSSNEAALAAFWHASLSITDDKLRENVQLALRILFFRFGHMGRLLDYLYKGHRVPYRNRYGHSKVCRVLAAEIMLKPNPMPNIHRALCPRFLRDEEFEYEFGEEASKFAKISESAIVDLPLLTTWSQVLRRISKSKLKGSEL